MASRGKARIKTIQTKRRHTYRLEPGLSGFLCTCNSKFKERDCVRESYSILNQFADTVFGPEDSLVTTVEGKAKFDERVLEHEEEEEEEDIDEALKREVESIKAGLNKKPELRRFQVVESGANGIVFIRSTVPDPVKLAHTIVTSLSQTQQSKFLLRLLPVELTCKAYLRDICKACEPLIDKYFSEGEKTFAIVYNHRNNDSIERETLIQKVADLVYKKNSNIKTDLKNPELAILIEVIRGVCCLAVVPDFYKLKKYNLMELVIRAKTTTENEPLEDETQV